MRHLEPPDAAILAGVLCDPVAMCWYPRPYTRPEVDSWIERNRERYQRDGFGLWAVEWRADGRLVGDCGLILQDLDNERVVELGYHVLPGWQGGGIATEAARACIEYARDVLRRDRVYAFVRPENGPSRRVASKVGMHVERQLIRGAGGFLHDIWIVDLPRLV